MTATPFHDLDDFVRLPRLSNLRLSPDGARLVVAVQQLDVKQTAYVSALWEVDPAGDRDARRLTRSGPGESSPRFTPDGALLFASTRPDAEAEEKSDDPRPALWLLPAGGGEARLIAERPGGIGGFEVAGETGGIALTSATMPGTTTSEDDAQAWKHRKDKKVGAILHDAAPIRLWDRQLGPDEERLLVGETGASGLPEGERLALRDLTPEPGRALDEASFDVAPDGRTVATTWLEREPRGVVRTDVAAIEITSGERRVLASDAAYEYFDPRISPDGRQVVCVRVRRESPEWPPQSTLWLCDLDGSGDGRDLTPELDLWPGAAQWSPDGRTIYFVADQLGRAPVFAVSVDTGAVRRLTSDAAYSDLQVAPDGQTIYALRHAIDAPAAPVRLATGAVDQAPAFLRGPAAAPELPGTLTEVTATAEDGTALRAWLALPTDASASTPAPLLLWIHGGPYGSWNAWSWRWSPWLAVARGYAVVLPDPALSTGYGQAFLERGTGQWGGNPYTDLMTITDACIARPDVDEARTAAMGGSFGGYMANWVAGHTDRFRAIVTHASLWELDQMGATTDFSTSWHTWFTPQQAYDNSPQRFADAIVTPMLVIHGDKDYRVPIGEGLRLWTDLVTRHDGPPEELPHRFLYFPTENHWVLTPEHAKVWYETVFAFLAWHVLGKEWERPPHL